MSLLLFMRAVLVSIIYLTSASIARAQDACVALLKHGIYTSHTTQSSAQTFQQFRSTFCSFYSSYRQAHSSESASASIPIVDIPLGLSGSLTFGEADALQQGLCSTQSGSSSDQAFWLDVAQFIDPAGADAFKECVKALRGGLSIDAQINDDETIAVISVAYTPPFGAGPATLNRVDFDGWDCPPPGGDAIDMRDIVGKTGQLVNNKVSIKCTRQVRQTPFLSGGQQIVADRALLSVSTTAGTYTQFFRPKLFADPLADTAKVLASYPKGTILPFAGTLQAIPAGWHLCDGTMGTVNLVNRLPYGASQDVQVGKPEGKVEHSHTFSGTTSQPGGVDNVHVIQNDNAPLTVKGVDHKHTFGGTTSIEPNLPPVTRIFFIQKIQ